MVEPTDRRKQLLFPLQRPAPPDQTFELGLVLGGTVSAGAYTAGALDMLLQALSAWYDAHNGNPPHNVSIPIVAGTSGGGVCATLLGLLSNRKISHIAEEAASLNASTADRGNKLFDIWINRFDIAKLLETEDLKGHDLPSALNCRLLDLMAAELVAYATQPGPTLDRPYFPKPYRWAVTLSNVRGIPYQLEVATLGGFTGAMFVQHDDFARFAIPNGASAADNPLGQREDEFWVTTAGGDPANGVIDYATMAQFALATAAFPVGFVGRDLQRPLLHYRLRPLVYPTATGVTWDNVKFPCPLEANMVEAGSTQYAFTSVDGGMFNNDPVRLVHRELAGLIGRNPREAENATRALFMIDPLAVKPRTLDKTKGDLFSVLSKLVGTAIEGGRYMTADMELLGDKNVFSRFQLVPSRNDDSAVVLGEEALAGTALGAFGGFCARPFRVHDFLLGRENMWNYLREILTLRGDNPLFRNWNDDMRRDHARDLDGHPIEAPDLAKRDSYYLPIIPVMQGVLTTGQPGWPAGALTPETLKSSFDSRAEAVLERARDVVLPGLGAALFGDPLIKLALSNIIADKIVKSFKGDLVRKRLL